MSAGADAASAAPPEEIVAVIAAATVVALRLGVSAPAVTAVTAVAAPGPSPWALAGRLDAAAGRRWVQRRPTGQR